MSSSSSSLCSLPMAEGGDRSGSEIFDWWRKRTKSEGMEQEQEQEQEQNQDQDQDQGQEQEKEEEKVRGDYLFERGVEFCEYLLKEFKDDLKVANREEGEGEEEGRWRGDVLVRLQLVDCLVGLRRFKDARRVMEGSRIAVGPSNKEVFFSAIFLFSIQLIFP